MSTHEAAASFIQSYAHAMSLAVQPPSSSTSTSTSSLLTSAQALASHYLPTFISFTSGHTIHMPPGTATENIHQHLQRFEKSGVGCDIRHVASRVEVVSEGGGSAVCWVKWGIRPKNDIEPWEWENLYGYRRMPDGKEGWEMVISDNEMAELMKRVPQFFNDYGIGGA